MGIYDRDYNRGDRYGDDGPMGFRLNGPLSLSTKLVLVMFGCYAVQLVTKPTTLAFPGDQGWFTNTFELHADLFRRPWMVFELLTYGFLHDVGDFWHILTNMLGLWMFGRVLEDKYGPREYLAFVLTAIVFAGLCWMIGELVAHREQLARMVALGASGGVVAVVILFAFNFPHQTVLFMFFIPMPMWLLGLIIVGTNIKGSLDSTAQVAYTAHLGGALFAALYYKSGLRLMQWLPGRFAMPRLRLGPRPKLRVHEPGEEDEDTDGDEVDNILRKISQHGQDSLTRRERRVLQQASQEEQKKRRGP